MTLLQNERWWERFRIEVLRWSLIEILLTVRGYLMETILDGHIRFTVFRDDSIVDKKN